MNKKKYKITLILFALVAVALIVTDAIWAYVDFLYIFIGISVVYIYIRYKVTTPLQQFSTKFNMLVDYDLDVEGALKMVQDQLQKAPTDQVEQLVLIYLGMGYYYNSMYDEAIKTFNQIKLNKVNQVYHILIYAFTAYAAYEMGDMETFNIALERMESAKQRINKKYFAFASSYMEILTAMKNLEVNPEGYREVIERNFSREDGYISTKLVYNYRMALYYKTVGNIEEMDKCFARVIANGKNHHTAIRSRSMFKGSVNVEDYVFGESDSNLQDVEVVEEPLQIDQMEEIEVIDESESIDVLFDEPDVFEAQKPKKDLASLSVAELKKICQDKGIVGYSKMKKAELIAEIERIDHKF